jgi:hypothetical protein
MKETCKHLRFVVHGTVNRLADSPDATPSGYMLDVTCRCEDCGIPFQFLGIRSGISSEHPNVSIDATELRVPIKPTNDPVENVRTITSGHAPHLRDPMEYPDGHPIFLGDRFKTPFGTITVKANSAARIDYTIDATRYCSFESRKEFADSVRTKKYLRL